MSKTIFAPNYTQVPNIIFDYWMHKLDHCTSIVLLYLCRKTFGWQKFKDSLSLSQIEVGTKMSRPRVIKSLNTLQEFGLIKKEMSKAPNGDQDINTYEIVIYEGVVNEIDQGGSKQNLPGVVNDVYTQKKPLQKKDIIIKESFGQYVKFSSEEYSTLCKNHGKPKVEEIIQSINDHCINNRPKGYIDYMAAFRNFVKNYKPVSTISTPKPFVSNREMIISKFKDGKIYNDATCYINDESIAFQRGMTHMTIKFKDYGFKDQLDNVLRKFQISI